mgnify:CR=1 FL=1|jgi:hypothetical protein
MDAFRFLPFCYIALLVAVMTGCSYGPFSKSTGTSQQTPREYAPAPATRPNYFADIKPVIDKRCVVCHACYDAPCQLKLESYQGLLRGAHKDRVYHAERLFEANLTRMYEDAETTAQWRDKGFFPMLNEFEDNPYSNLENSVLAQLLLMKQRHPFPTQAQLSSDFDLRLVRDQSCPHPNEMESYRKKHPLGGMPYALPALSKREHLLMMEWLREGAPSGMPSPLPESVLTQVVQWEAFLNGDSFKVQLVGRYIYEHLFLASLHFDVAPGIYFHLVRSSTPPGQPIKRISTTRPFDDPGVPRVYYRFWQDPDTPVAKTHMPYLLDDKRWSKWQKWFLQEPYTVDQLPGYEPEKAANPFATFAQIPVGSRYRFLLEESQFSIMNFIKGPVCRGTVALNVIQDHFWVFFLAPDGDVAKYEEELFQRAENYLNMPAEKGSSLLAIGSWLTYSQMQRKYLSAKAETVTKFTRNQVPLNLDLIWDGDGVNPNAALTVFRHSDSASVHQGLIGTPPKTAWIIGYPLLERIHYLLVAGFDVYGNVSHQLLTRLYMDFLRMEGEMNFVALLPSDVQKSTIAGWYVNAEGEQKKYLDFYLDQLQTKTDLKFTTDDPKQELLDMLTARLGKVAESPLQLDFATSPLLRPLQNLRGPAVQILPETTVIRVPGLGLFTLVRHNHYTNLSSLFGEEQRRWPEEDQITLTRGIVGSYPNSFMQVEQSQLGDFVNRLANLQTEEDFTALRDRYGVRRTDARFWAFSDTLHREYQKLYPADAALLDYNRLENR